MQNSPRPSCPTRSFSCIPKFKLDIDSDGNLHTDDDDDEGEPYVLRLFSESSIMTAEGSHINMTTSKFPFPTVWFHTAAHTL